MLILLLACEPDQPTKAGCASCEGECVAEHLLSDGADHVEGDVLYDDPPPASGDHAGCWASWGPHTEAVPPETWVHNLEHGGVVLLYDCPDGCDDDVAALAALGAGWPTGRWLLTPWDGERLARPVAALAWQERLTLGCVDLERIQTFFDTYVATAPEDVTAEPSEACLEGTGGGM